MAIEAIKGAGMTYQGSSSSAEVRADAQVRTEHTQVANVSTQLAKETMNMTAKGASADGGGYQGGAQAQPQKAQIEKAVEEINKRAHNSEAIFGVHEETNRVTIKIVDKETKEIIKEFPPEKTLDMIAKVWEMAGLFVDEKR